MVQRLIVPVDGSEESWSAVDIAVALGRRCDASVHVVEVVESSEERAPALARLDDELARHDTGGVEVSVAVDLASGSVAEHIEVLVGRDPGATVVMASHGRGRSAAIVGSVADDVLNRTFGPLLIVGPNAVVSDFSGPVVVSVDGSDESEAALPLAAAWSIELRSSTWVVHAVGDDPIASDDLIDSGYPNRLARHLRATSGHQVEFDELHGGHPAVAVPEFADGIGASLIVASSHGRSGWSRLTMGSVTSGFIRHARCPVLVVRLPNPARAGGERVAWAF